MSAEYEALLRSVLSNLGDNTPRLILAEWLEENGQADRAEFIRLQVELAITVGAQDPNCVRYTEQMRICGSSEAHGYFDTNTLSLIPCVDCWRGLRRRELESWHRLPTHKEFASWAAGIAVDHTKTEFYAYPDSRPPIHMIVSRGFVSSLSCSWSDWLRHEKELYWWSGATDECPNRCFPNAARGDRSYVERITIGKAVGAALKICGCSRGRIVRPVPPHAQPLERVKLTDIGGGTNSMWPQEVDWFNMATDDGGVRFIRMKCSACDGLPLMLLSDPPRPACDECHGRPLNIWTCEAWGPLVFEMPG